MLEFIIAMENEAGEMCFFCLVSCYEILLCGKITGCAAIYIWIKSEITQDGLFLRFFFYCFSMTAKKEEEGKEGGHPQKVCTTGVFLPSALILKLLK